MPAKSAVVAALLTVFQLLVPDGHFAELFEHFLALRFKSLLRLVFLISHFCY